MTEAEWLACEGPEAMLEFLRGRASDRKLRLFAVGCVRRLWRYFPEDTRRQIEQAERIADGLGSMGPAMGRDDPHWITKSPMFAAESAIWTSARSEANARAALMRDVWGDLFRRLAIKSAWRTATVTSLAQAIYDERAFDRMPILGDGLEDAGCADADILGHCRGGGEHVRGCWVVDLVLGKE